MEQLSLFDDKLLPTPTRGTLRVLVWSNPLVVDKIGKQFLYWKDSGFIVAKHLIEMLPKSYRFYWVVPASIEDIGWFLEANKNIQIIPYPYSTNIHQNRYEFYGNVLKRTFPYTMDIDAVLCHQPEIATNISVWSKNQRRDNPPIFSFFHWIDCEKSRQFARELGGYYLRQYDGFVHSEKSYFHQEYAYALFREQFEKEFGAPMPDRGYGYFNPPPTIFGQEPIDLPDKKIVLFNHRLNNTTNWQSVVKAAKEVYQSRQDFVLWMTDESNLRHRAELEKQPFIIVQHVKPESYGYLISNCHFGVCNHSGYSTWNMALLDAFENGCFMTVPDSPSYKHMFGDAFPYYIDDSNLQKVFLKLLNTSETRLETMRHLTLVSAPCFDKNMNQHIALDIESAINRRLPKSKPAKYDDVISEIRTKGIVSKRDIVNKFWSFHVNSNFQKIRWQLLRDGILDNTLSPETLYYTKEYATGS